MMFLRKFILAIIYIQKRFSKFNWNKVGIGSILPFERIKDWLFQLRGLSRVHNFDFHAWNMGFSRRRFINHYGNSQLVFSLFRPITIRQVLSVNLSELRCAIMHKVRAWIQLFKYKFLKRRRPISNSILYYLVVLETLLETKRFFRKILSLDRG